MRHHPTRSEAREAKRIAFTLALVSVSLKDGLHAQAVEDGKAQRKRGGLPRRKPLHKLAGQRIERHPESWFEEKPKVTATKAAELEALARAHFGDG